MALYSINSRQCRFFQLVLDKGGGIDKRMCQKSQPIALVNHVNHLNHIRYKHGLVNIQGAFGVKQIHSTIQICFFIALLLFIFHQQTYKIGVQISPGFSPLSFASEVSGIAGSDAEDATEEASSSEASCSQEAKNKDASRTHKMQIAFCKRLIGTNLPFPILPAQVHGGCPDNVFM